MLLSFTRPRNSSAKILKSPSLVCAINLLCYSHQLSILRPRKNPPLNYHKNRVPLKKQRTSHFIFLFRKAEKTSKKMISTPDSKLDINGRRIPENSIFSTPKWPSSRRTPSLSSSSSISSSSFRSPSRENSPPASPATPLHHFHGGGIPFSWETIPGIPKNQILKKIDSCQNHSHLPLPPAAAPVSASSNKFIHHKKHITSPMDPFLVALVECSKSSEDDEKITLAKIKKGARHERSRSDKFGFVNNLSCKNSSAVAESLVLLPKGPRRIGYDVLKKRSG